MKQKNKIISFSSKLVTCFSLFGILLLLNSFIQSVPIRIDLTDNNMYTLSNSSRAIVKSLDDIINIKVYFSKKLPPYVSQIKQQVLDILSEYRLAARHKIKIEVIDPASDPQLEFKLRQMNIPKVQLNIIEKDQRQVVDGYLGIGIFFEDRYETIPVVQNIENLEYDLTTAIKKLSAKTQPVLSIVSNNKPEFSKTYSLLEKELRKQYELNIITPSDNIPAETTTLITTQPQQYSNTFVSQLEAHLANGHKAILLVDPVRVEQGLQATVTETGLNPLFQKMGVSVQPNMVLDRYLSYASFSGGFFNFSLPYPYWPKLINTNFAKNHPIFYQIDFFVVPWASSLSIEKVNTQNATATLLATSSQHAWTAENNFNLNPRQNFTAHQKETKTYPMLIHWAGKINETAQITSVVIAGDSNFAQDQFVRQFPNNLRVLLNIIDWLSLDNDLITIRSRNKLENPIHSILNASAPVTEIEKLLAKIIGSLLLPIGLILFGLIRFWLHRQKKQRLTYE